MESLVERMAKSSLITSCCFGFVSYWEEFPGLDVCPESSPGAQQRSTQQVPRTLMTGFASLASDRWALRRLAPPQFHRDLTPRLLPRRNVETPLDALMELHILETVNFQVEVTFLAHGTRRPRSIRASLVAFQYCSSGRTAHYEVDPLRATLRELERMAGEHNTGD